MNLLLTGGAGFIGSHILETALHDDRISKIRVIDNLSTGFIKNIEPFIDHHKVEFVECDLRDKEIVHDVMNGMDCVCHQAALGSVPRSINDPQMTNDHNVNGFINMLWAAKEAGVKRIVYASSSSVYGDAAYKPKVEHNIGNPLSPYAVSKRTNELYADVFARCYGIRIAGLRYFNVFGPRQDPHGPYAAVVPLFFKHAISNISPTINGDGSITRDYTYVKNVAKANLNALMNEAKFEGHEVFNIACGSTTTLTDLWLKIKQITDSRAEATYGPNRPGDILHSLADVSKAEKMINYTDLIDLHTGLQESLEWYTL